MPTCLQNQMSMKLGGDGMFCPLLLITHMSSCTARSPGRDRRTAPSSPPSPISIQRTFFVTLSSSIVSATTESLHLPHLLSPLKPTIFQPKQRTQTCIMSDFESSERNEVVNVTPDGGVTKTVLREGTGETPPLHARCLGEWAARLWSKHFERLKVSILPRPAPNRTCSKGG